MKSIYNMELINTLIIFEKIIYYEQNYYVLMNLKMIILKKYIKII